MARPRKLTDAQLSIIRRWKSLSQLAREWGINRNTVLNARRYHYRTKKPA